MKCYDVDVVFQEVPGEISLAFHCTGCPIHCPACHSKWLWDAENGTEFTDDYLLDHVGRYAPNITCVLFYGGEWDAEWLKGKLYIVRKLGLKTALYTGLDEIGSDIKSRLDYLKTGPFDEKLGGLTSRTTNQRMFDLKNDKDITSKFWRK